MPRRRFEPYRDDHSTNHTRLRSEFYNALAEGDNKFAVIASQFLKTDYEDFLIDR